MARRLDKILVIDVESTCWEQHPPRGQISEIIEIGVCLLDVVRLAREERRSILVRPQLSTVSPFCTRLTSITPEMVAEASPLADALETLRRELRCAERVFASWGDYDRNQFQRNCAAFELEYPFGPTHLNVKTLFALALGLPREPGLDEAFERLGWRLEGTHHRGGDDAWNIARVLAWCLERSRGDFAPPA